MPINKLDKIPATCALDVAEEGSLSLEETGEKVNLTRERIRQMELAFINKLRDSGCLSEWEGTSFSEVEHHITTAESLAPNDIPGRKEMSRATAAEVQPVDENQKMTLEEVLIEAERTGIKFQVAEKRGDICDGALVTRYPSGYTKSKRLDWGIWDHKEGIKARIQASSKSPRGLTGVDQIHSIVVR